MNNRKFAYMPPPNRDLISRLFRKIGISAVAAALEAKAYEPQKSNPQARRTSRPYSGVKSRRELLRLYLKLPCDRGGDYLGDGGLVGMA